MSGPRLAWVIAGLDIVAILGVGLVSPTLGIEGAVLFAFGIASFAVVGALLINRVPTNPIGSLLLTAGTLLAGAMVVGAYADIGGSRVPPWAGSDVARVVQTTLFVPPFFIALIGVPLVFPDGHLPSRRFVWIVGLAIADIVTWPVASLLRALLSGELDVKMADPGFLAPLLGVLEAFFLIATGVSFAAGATAIALRFRRGGVVEREQIKWLMAVVAVGAAILPLSFVATDESNPEVGDLLANLTIFTLFALPIVIAVAILRYRLYEIDRIVSRTISWAVVSAMLVAAFMGGVLLMQTALAGITQGQTLAVAGSTLLAFALFQPLRRRVQRAVDRRFDRAAVDRERTSATYAERVRSEVDLPRITDALMGSVRSAVRPAGVGVWLRGQAR